MHAYQQSVVKVDQLVIPRRRRVELVVQPRAVRDHRQGQLLDHRAHVVEVPSHASALNSALKDTRSRIRARGSTTKGGGQGHTHLMSSARGAKMSEPL